MIFENNPLADAACLAASAFGFTLNMGYCLGFGIDFLREKALKREDTGEDPELNFSYTGSNLALLGACFVGGVVVMPAWQIAYDEAVSSAAAEKQTVIDNRVAERARQDSIAQIKPVALPVEKAFTPYNVADFKGNFMSEQKLPANYVMPRLAAHRP